MIQKKKMVMTMDKTILIPTVLLSLLIIGYYLFRCWKFKKQANNAVLINSVLNSSGIVCGIALGLSPFFPTVKALIGGT